MIFCPNIYIHSRHFAENSLKTRCLEQMKNVLAVIIIDPLNRTIKDMSLIQKQFQFKCKRCASLCCKLGGPVLTRNEAELIESAGCCVSEFLEPGNSDKDFSPLVYGRLKSRKDGSCIFLKFDAKQNCHKCGIYDVRPALCRLYPFCFEMLGSNKIALKFIPCCMGLNNPNGKKLDKEFVSNYLLEPLLEATKLL